MQLAVQHYSHILILRKLWYLQAQWPSFWRIGPDPKRNAARRVFVPQAAYLRKRVQVERDELAAARVYSRYRRVKIKPGAPVVEHTWSDRRLRYSSKL